MKTRKIKERNDSSWRRKKIANSPPQNPSSIILSQGENGQIREIKHIFQINLANLPTWNNNWYSRNMISSPSKKSKTKHQEKYINWHILFCMNCFNICTATIYCGGCVWHSGLQRYLQKAVAAWIIRLVHQWFMVTDRRLESAYTAADLYTFSLLGNSIR